MVVDKAASTIATAVLMLMARQTPGWTPTSQADARSALQRPGESRLSAALRARRRRVRGRVDPRRDGSDRGGGAGLAGQPLTPGRVGGRGGRGGPPPPPRAPDRGPEAPVGGPPPPSAWRAETAPGRNPVQ